MKNNQLTGMLVGLLLLSTLCSVGLIYKYNGSIRTLQHLEPRLQQVNIMQSLLNDTIKYNEATKNPDMLRILQTLSPPKAAKPATK
jgi:hypothetical protein